MLMNFVVSAVLPFFLSFLAFSSIASANTHNTPQRFIIFGDSLSDTGNYPEPANVSSPQLKNFNVYIPVTNPVPSNLYGQDFTPTADFLSQAIGKQGRIDNKIKVLYSINWPLYLVYNTNQSYLATWHDHYKNPTKSVESINYAWAGALARGNNGSDKCYHEGGAYLEGACTARSISKQRALYLKHTAQDPNYDKNNSYSFTDLEIPNLGKQVSLYLNDKTVSVKDNTTFLIYIGANDIGDYLGSIIGKISLLPLKTVEPLINKQMLLASLSVKRAVQKLNLAYADKHLTYKIYVFTLPKISNLHEVHNYNRIPVVGKKIVKSADYAVAVYNNDLKEKLKGMKNVIVLDTGDHIDQLALSAQYKDSAEKGTACIKDKSGDYLNPSLDSNANCTYNNGDEIYFSWNNAHFVSDVNENLAKYILKSVK